MPVTVIEGTQRGDEGKGCYVDTYMPEFDMGARFNGGNNAGHTIVSETGEIYKTHSLPSSILHEGKSSIIGNGTVVNMVHLQSEIDTLRGQGIEINESNLYISLAAHLIMPQHVSLDQIREAGEGRQGSTASGIAFAYADKSRREGFQVGTIHSNSHQIMERIETELIAQRGIRAELQLPKLNEAEVAREYVEAAKKLGGFTTDTQLFINRELRKDKPARILAEGAQAFLLDIDHGMYPDVTSSTTIAAGACDGLGIGTRFIENTLGIVKAIPSHVGGGHFVTQITSDPERLARLYGDMDAPDAEKGATTGRLRLLGDLDLPQLRRAIMISDPDSLILTKFDCLDRHGDEIPVCTRYIYKGELIKIAPGSADELKQCEPVFEYKPGWKEDISGVRKFSDLPTEAQSYLDYLEAAVVDGIEDLENMPINMIGVGPGRDQVIVRR